MYKQMFAVYLASTMLVFAAGNTWSVRIQNAAELDRMGRFSEAGEVYSSIVDEARQLPSSDPRRSEAFNNAGSHAYYTGDFTAADSFYSNALRAYKDAKEDNKVKLASILANSAALYKAEARYAEAEKAARGAVAVNASAGHAWMNLAEVYRAEGKLEEAETAAREGLEIAPATQQDAGMQTLAGILRQRGRYDDALALYNRALKSEEERNSASAATTLANLAEIYMHRAEWSKAEAAASRALQIWETGGVRATPNMAATYNNLAQIRKLQGRYAEAEPLYRKALAAWETAVGKNHPDYAKGLTNLADFFHATGNDRAADELYRRAAEILSASAGEPDRGLTARRVEVLHALGRHTDAQRVANPLR